MKKSLRQFNQSIARSLGKKFRKYIVEIQTNKYRFDQLFPDYYRKAIHYDVLELIDQKTKNQQYEN